MSAEEIAAALQAAGFDPPPFVGEVWIDEHGPSYPGAHSTTTTITALGNTVTGWQARVRRREFNQAGHLVYDSDGLGRIYVKHLTTPDGIFRHRRATPSEIAAGGAR